MTRKPSSGARPYRMRARAEATAATREKILDAAEATLDELSPEDATLAVIAERAGVTVQTILRHFESRDGLAVATIVRLVVRMRANRDEAPVGDVDGAIDILVDHYEEYGDRLLRALAEEDRHPMLRSLTDMGREYHLDWCKRTFAPFLTGLRGHKRERRVAQLVAVTDVYTWKLLRQDRGVGPQQVKVAMRELLGPVIGANS